MTNITRHNWRSHCQEPQLTADEWRRWEAVAERIRANDDFTDAVFEATEAEWQAERAAGKLPGWTGLVAWADASRRYKRAVIAVGEKLASEEQARIDAANLELSNFELSNRQEG